MRPIMTRAELAAHQVDAYGRDYSVSDDGYSDMEAESVHGWTPIAGWGVDGWDLGDWPYVVISTRHRGNDITPERWEVMQTVEGDRTVYSFDVAEDCRAAIDYLFLWYAIGRQAEALGDGDPDWANLGAWDADLGNYPARVALDAGTLTVPERLRGPYSAKRHEVGEHERAR